MSRFNKYKPDKTDNQAFFVFASGMLILVILRIAGLL